jgi:ribonuclease HII
MHVGIDEAGRGPVIGPLVVCAAGISEDNLLELESLNLKDSKKYTRKKREELEESILSIAKCQCTEISAVEIDFQMRQKTLNDIEVELFAQVISHFPHATKIIVDACDVDEIRFGERICFHAGISFIISEHKADDTYPVVSAASIIAKIRRDRRVDELKEIHGDFGSGYCSDKKTIKFLKEYIKKEGKLPPIARSSWDTAKRLLEEYYQCSLDNFL